MKYIVKREHYGDRAYRAGDEREADPSSVAHLVVIGVLVAAEVAAIAHVETAAAEASTEAKRARRK